jgi:hypothetical protein
MQEPGMYLASDENDSEQSAGVDQVRLTLQEIARAEITRHRRRLGQLTAEQQSAVEELLISTADQISGRLIQRLQDYPSDLRAKYLNVWNPQLAA